MAKQGSRLTRSLERQSKKQLYIFVAATIIILTTLGVFSTKILDAIGSVMISDEDRNSSTQEQTVAPVTPPHFDEIPSATQTNTIKITGSVSREDGTVEIFVNNRKVSTKKIESNRKFEITGIKISEGENAVKGRYILGDRKSEFTRDYIVHFTKEAPKIDGVSPSDGAEFKRGDQEIVVRGTTEPLNTVTVNDFIAIVNQQGEFSYFLRLNEGDNTIRIKAVSPTGQETVKELKVTYHP